MQRSIWLVVAWLAVAMAGCGASEHTAIVGTEDCTNGVDDNDDGDIDCEDEQCAGHAACRPMSEFDCTNGLDDDGDGQTDCADPDCHVDQACNRDRELNCTDGMDNDGDGLVDCADPDCQQSQMGCVEVCDDGVDNDTDGLVDCADPDCQTAPGCHREVCDNDLDDDGDGLKDCDDPDCAGLPACQELELCDNDLDDDGDGLTDCADPDCATNPYCFETNCLDGYSNDADADIDCDDADCANAPACQANGECHPAEPLGCDQYVSGTTVGRLDNLQSYPCASGTFGGPERYYVFTAPHELYLDLYLSDYLQHGLQLFVTAGDPAGGCSPTDGCETADNTGSGYLPLWIEAGTTMYVIVDGPAGQAGDFELSMYCTLTQETGFCGDGLDNDYDYAVDCWDDDCLGDPGCDYWISAGTSCEGDWACAPGEYCEQVFFQGTTDTVGFCTRPCSVNGTVGGECATDGYGDGHCSGFLSGGGLRCVLPCGSPTDPCPLGTVCTDFVSGSTTNLVNGFCLPVQLP